ncbi:GNAT family N-acetyltransferase [Indioceanicola profundi]|uniref:GNAT family N-acetyltransferase n=1 Tax=Indioceanicola profundi TaxID=2220096 RepID=UPI000E6AC0BF|nr:GNAT family N-acetyltransferase [Indioceanicola profundi]
MHAAIVTVREARPSDADIFAAMVAALSVEEGVGPPGLTPSVFRRDGFGPDRRFQPLMGELASQPAGIALLTRGYDSHTGSAGVVLEDIYVEPHARRHGLGGALIAEAARISADGGGCWVAWHVRRGNTRAQLFYRSLGAASEIVDTMAIAGAPFARLAAAAASPSSL